jgi:CubicO group peptidase (beta-lactamase class C family)
MTKTSSPLGRSINSLLARYLFAFAIGIICFMSQAEQSSLKTDNEVSDKQVIVEQPKKFNIGAEKLAKIEDFVQQSMQHINVPGVSVGIIKQGVPLLLKGYGVSNSSGDLVTEKTPFKLGSVSKSFTALAVMQLYQQGKVDINHPVVNYIPWFRITNKKHSDLILVKHLMSHKSGFSTIDGNRNQHSEDKSANALKNAVSELSKIDLVTSPGENYQYSNANYQVLGYLLEVLEGKSYESVITENIFKPLNMVNSAVQTQSGLKATRTQGYLLSYGDASEFEDTLGRTTIAQGGLYSSAEDMLIYLSHYLNESSHIITADSSKQMISSEGDTSPFGYGFGWYFYHQGDYRMIYHSGVSAGYETGVLFSPELDIALVVLTNASSGFGLNNVSGIVSGVSNIIFDAPAPSIDAPSFEKIVLSLIILTPLLILILATIFIRKYNNGSKHPLQRPVRPFELIKRLIIPSIFLLGIVYIVLIVLPELNGATLNAVKLFQPLVFTAALICAGVCLSWFIVRSILLFRTVKVG